MFRYRAIHKKTGLNIWLGLCLLVFMAACSKEEPVRTVDTLKIAVLPDQSESQLRMKYQPLIEHLNSHAGVKSKLLIPKSYKELLQWFEFKQVDLAMFGGVTYVKAHLNFNALPLVMRDVDGDFRSVALVRVNNSAKSLKDLKGSSLAFGSELSTSGHFMPRYFLQKKNINPETFFSNTEYSGAHDLTAEWVRDGKVDVGFSNSGVVNAMFADGRLKNNQVKIIWRSPPFSDYVWAIQSDISKQQRIKIRDAFLHMNHDDEDKALLKHLGANYYIPSVGSDFSELQQVILDMQQREVSP